MKRNKPDGRLIMSLIFAIVGIFFYFCLSGYYFIAYTCWALALIILYYWLMKRIRSKFPKTEKILNRIMSYGIVLFCMVFAITEGALIYGSAPAEQPEADYAIVLGAGINGTQPSKSLQYRLEAALDYLNENPNAVCIVSGSQAEDEDISEAECMRVWLENNGIPADRIIKEEQADNTKENIAFSLALIENLNGAQPDKVAVITEGFHMTRASLILRDSGVKPLAVPAKTGLPILAANHYIREAFALWKYLILG